MNNYNIYTLTQYYLFLAYIFLFHRILAVSALLCKKKQITFKINILVQTTEFVMHFKSLPIPACPCRNEGWECYLCRMTQWPRTSSCNKLTTYCLHKPLVGKLNYFAILFKEDKACPFFVCTYVAMGNRQDRQDMCKL